jgi:serine/threonine protein kinase
MPPSSDNSGESRLSRLPIVICTVLAALMIATRRIEFAILLLGLLAVSRRKTEDSCWRFWAVGFASISITTILVAASQTGEHVPPEHMPPGSRTTYMFTNTLTPWLAACVIPIIQGYLRWKVQRRTPRSEQTLLSAETPDFDSQQTFDILHVPDESEDTEIQGSLYTDFSHHTLSQPKSRFNLRPAEVDRLVNSLRRDGDFSDVQLRLLTDSLRQTIFRHPSDVTDLLTPGRELGSYTIKKLLNQGGGGRVYVAQHKLSDQLVALKVLKSQKLSSRFRREMSLVEKLAHPNIVVAYEVDEQDGFPFIAMELLSGVDLHAHVRAEGRTDYATSLSWILQAARALAHADERGLTHRDVKPGNLILHRDNVVKLADLGLAVLRSSESDSVSEFVTQDAAVVGTLEFMAPEQAKSLSSADARSDIFGLGATWFFLLEGKTQLPGHTLKAQLSALLVDRNFHLLSEGVMPAHARKVIDRMIAFDPEDRFQDWNEVIEALLALSDDADSSHAPSIQVLLIEDNEDDVVLTTRLLSKMNHSVLVHEATTFTQAKELLSQRIQFDVILSDLQLPDSAGLDTVKAIRECDPSTPLVILSGFSDASIGQACIDAGANAFASKNDLNVHELERTIFITRSQCESTSRDQSDVPAGASTH